MFEMIVNETRIENGFEMSVCCLRSVFFVDKDVSIFNKISNVPFKLSFHFSFDKESERERENEKNLITQKSSLS